MAIIKDSRLELRQISKSFSGVMALDSVSFQAEAGQCVGLVGENGAGKSTLMKVLSGVWPQGSYQGQILLNGIAQDFRSPKDALSAGVAIIHQELSLFEDLTVADNLWMLGFPSRYGLLDADQIHKESQEVLSRFHLRLDPTTIVRDLNVGEKQILEIARAFTRDVRILILDEPTSALSDHEIQNLFGLIDNLKRQGVICLYISHKLDEIDRLCDRVVVLRDGRSVREFEAKTWTSQSLIEAMVGREIASIFPPRRMLTSSRTLLSVSNLSYRIPQSERLLLEAVSFDVREGEIFGIAGLMGSRRSELLNALFGSLSADKVSGSVIVDGQPLSLDDPSSAIQCGFGLVTEDRKESGLFLDRSLRENITLSILKSISRLGKVKADQERQVVEHFSKVLRIKAASSEILVRYLSGGNQQKAILGRWLSTKPRILFLDEPTRGIDVRAKSEIYFLIRELVDQGLTIVMVSSELAEIVSLCDRVMVLREGRSQGVLEGSEITQQKIMERAVA